MKLGTFVFLGAAGLMSMGLAGALSVGGCGSSSTGSGSGSGGGSSGGSSSGGSGSGGGITGNASCDDGGLCNLPPAAPTTGTAAPGTTAQNFALHHIHLGDELNAAGAPDWQSYGYNLDNKNTVVASTDVCTLAPNANKKNQNDGPGGIDNSFGENIMVLLTAVVSGPSATIDNSIALGHFTVMMDVSGLTPGAGQSSTGLTGQIFAGVPFNQAPNSTATTTVPTFTTADNWPVDPSYVTSAVNGTTLATPVTSKVSFTGAYVSGGNFVSGTPTDITLTLSISGQQLQVPIKHAIITFNHPGLTDAGTADTHISGGIIAGVIDANDLVNNLQGVAGNLEAALCQGSVFDQLKNSILQTADIMDDGTNQPGTPCDGISIGIGFDGDEIGQPQVTGVPTVGVNPCLDGGADSGSEDSGTPADSGGD